MKRPQSFPQPPAQGPLPPVRSESGSSSSGAPRAGSGSATRAARSGSTTRTAPDERTEAPPKKPSEKPARPRISGDGGAAASVPTVTLHEGSAAQTPDPDKELRRAARERKKFERGEVRRFTRRTRRRRWLWIGSAGVVVLVLLAVVLAAFSPLMALRTIQVEGATAAVSSSAVQSAVKGQLGTPLPLINPAAIRGELAALPLIRSYSTEIVPPGTLVIRIVERTPVGVVHDGSSWLVVDAARVPLSSSPTRPAGYPSIKVSGVVGSPGEVHTFGAVAAVIQALPPSVLGQVDTISATTPDDVTLKFVDKGPTVVWGTSSQSALKAAVLARLMALPAADKVSEYDVSSPSSVVTR